MKKAFIILALLIPACASANPGVDGTCGPVTATNCVLSAVHAGDVIIYYILRSGSATLPGTPSGYTLLDSHATSTGGTPGGEKLACFVATGSTTTTLPTSTNATSVNAVAYNGIPQSCAINPGNGTIYGIGSVAGIITKATTTMTCPALTMSITNGRSWVACFEGGSAASFCTPGSMSARNAPVASVDSAGYDTNAGIASWAIHTCTVSTETAGAEVVELVSTTCSGDVYTNITCAQQIPVSSPGCAATAGPYTFTSGQVLYLATSDSSTIHNITGVALSGGDTGTQITNLNNTSWAQGTDAVWSIPITHTGSQTISFTATAGDTCENNGIVVSSSVGTPTVDCSSTFSTVNPGTTLTSSCTSSKANDLGFDYINFAANPLTTSANWYVNLDFADDGEKIIGILGAADTPSETTTFGSTPAIQGMIAISDGASSGATCAPTFGLLGVGGKCG